MENKARKTLMCICESAVMIALAAALSFIKIKLWGNGGSIDLVMIPLLVLAYRRGALWAVPSGMIFGLIKCLISEGFGYGAVSVLLDYVLAYGVVGLAGLFRNGKFGLEIGTVVGSIARLAVHFISGVTVWKIALGDSYELFGTIYTDSMAVGYSLIYNGSYMLANMLIALAVAALLHKPLERLKQTN